MQIKSVPVSVLLRLSSARLSSCIVVSRSISSSCAGFAALLARSFLSPAFRVAGCARRWHPPVGIVRPEVLPMSSALGSSYRNVPELASCASSAETSGGSHPQPGSLKPWPSAVPPAFPRDAANAAMIDCNMLQLQLQLQLPLHCTTLHYTTRTKYITYITLRDNYNYTTLHYTTLLGGSGVVIST